jgi:MFS family permease
MAESSLNTNIPDSISKEEVPAEEPIHEVFQIPTRSLSWTYRALFALASIVTGLCNVTIKQLLLPAQVGFLDPTNKFTTFALIASVGALAGVIIAPLAGALSDRTVSRWGRRRPWIIFGIIFAVVGGLVGLLLVARFTDATRHPQQGYYLLAGASCVLVILFLIVLRDKPLPRGAMPPFRFTTFLAGFWLSPRKYPDFGYTWLSRSLIFLGYTILISYILYYLQDVIHYQGADKGVAIFQLIATGTLILSAIIGGIFADKVQRLKPFVSGGAVLMMIALLLIAFVPKWPVMLVGAVILGIGFGVYLAVDIALAVRVLPAASNRGKDLGIINTAIFLPLIFSPIIGAVVLNLSHNYSLLFAVAALCFLLAAVLILPIKGVR